MYWMHVCVCVPRHINVRAFELTAACLRNPVQQNDELMTSMLAVGGNPFEGTPSANVCLRGSVIRRVTCVRACHRSSAATLHPRSSLFIQINTARRSFFCPCNFVLRLFSPAFVFVRKGPDDGPHHGHNLLHTLKRAMARNVIW